jgi:DNA polymerase I-like protein with 3'-5' exonuclease and polymerase domains
MGIGCREKTECVLDQKQKHLSSWAQAQRQVGTILAKLNEDQDLMLAAAANPLFALEELGYQIDENLKQEFEDRIRFGPRTAPKLIALREQIFKAAGRAFDLNSSDALAEILSPLVRPDKAASSLSSAATAQAAYTRKPDRPGDALESLRNAHPIMEPLLEYRRIQAGAPRLATRELYDEIRQKKRALPLTKLVANLKSDA